MSMYRQVAYLRNRFYRVAQVSHRYLLKTFRFEFNITAQPTLPSFRCWRKQSQIRFSAMSACRAEHTASGGSGQFGHGHGNGHGHGHGGCDDHGHDADPERGLEESLYPFIDHPHVVCFNELQEGSGRSCFRPWFERSDARRFVESDADEQLLFFIPFTGNVKLKSIRIVASDPSKRPTKMKAFKNRDDVDFDLAETLHPTQEWDLPAPPPGDDGLAFETRTSLFQGVHSLVLYFPENAGGDDTTKIEYIALTGQCDQVVRRTVITVAEVAANPADHAKIKVRVGDACDCTADTCGQLISSH